MTLCASRSPLSDATTTPTIVLDAPCAESAVQGTAAVRSTRAQCRIPNGTLGNTRYSRCSTSAYFAYFPAPRKCSDTYISRSEERRVGKECRSRWSPYDEK